MFILGHIGITLGCIKIYEKTSLAIRRFKEERDIDYRYVIIGSMLPDFIDKPLVLLLANTPVRSARFAAHSLLFLLVMLLLSAIGIFKFKSNKFLILTIGAYFHLILDKMWLYPDKLLWPLPSMVTNNKSAPAVNIVKKVENAYTSVKQINWMRMYSDPKMYIPELIGLLIIVFYLIKLISKGRLKIFIERGKI